MGLKERLELLAFEIVLIALFPRLARPRSRRRIAIGVVVQTLIVSAIHHWLKPWSARVSAEREHLTVELGREPSDEELMARLRG